MKKQLILFSFIIALVIKGWAHCEVPCGIYDDKARLKSILENALTIEKAMTNISEEESKNQIVRWVMNKESHATKIQKIIFQYFLTQRIKESHKNYNKILVVLHKMLIATMKCKQTTDVKYVKELRTLTDKFAHLYLSISTK